MKTFLWKIGLLSLIVIFADRAIGYGLNYITSNIRVGGQGRDNYIANGAKEKILVFGSSRAVHHYNSQMIEELMGKSCYNCGDDGSGIILSYGRLLMVKERYQPTIIIQDVYPEFDLMKNDNHKYIGWLKVHYNRECIHPIFEDVDRTEKYKMMSHLYRFNSRFLQNVITYITGIANDDGIKGFRPLEGNIDKMKLKIDNKKGLGSFDSLKLDYVNKFIDLAEGAKLYFVVSPIWYGMDSLQIKPLYEICKKRGIPLIDYSNREKYVHHNEWFKDGTHLNAHGADEFTRDLINEIL